jgi:hypothetical protein
MELRGGGKIKDNDSGSTIWRGWDLLQLFGLYTPTLHFSISNCPALHFKKIEIHNICAGR